MNEDNVAVLKRVLKKQELGKGKGKKNVYSSIEIGKIMGWNNNKVLWAIRDMLESGAMKVEEYMGYDILGRYGKRKGYKIV